MRFADPRRWRKMARWARVSRLAVLSAFAVGGCLVSFGEYPVGDLNPESGPSGGGAGAAGTGGDSGTGAAGSGGSAAVDSSAGGSSAGGSSTGGSLGGGGTAGTASGAGGTGGAVDGSPDADANCGDTLSNPQHCGRCNHDCCGGLCVGGRCRPFVVYEGPDGGNEAPQDVAVHGDYVYFSSARISGVLRVPMSGGAPIEVWNKKQHMHGVAVDATGLYVIGNDDASQTGLVERVPLDLTPPQLILDRDDSPGEITQDETYVYWRSWRSIIRRLQKGTTTVGQVGRTFEQGLQTIAVSNGFVFFHTYANTGQIVKIPRLGGAEVPLASAQPSVGGLAANRDYVFWSATDAASIRRINVNASPQDLPTDLATNQNAPQAVLADDVYVYWVNYGNPTGTLNAKPVGGGDQITVASDLGLPRKFALHEHCVYIATGAPPGRIVRVAKP